MPPVSIAYDDLDSDINIHEIAYTPSSSDTHTSPQHHNFSKIDVIKDAIAGVEHPRTMEKIGSDLDQCIAFHSQLHPQDSASRFLAQHINDLQLEKSRRLLSNAMKNAITNQQDVHTPIEQAESFFETGGSTAKEKWSTVKMVPSLSRQPVAKRNNNSMTTTPHTEQKAQRTMEELHAIPFVDLSKGEKNCSIFPLLRYPDPKAIKSEAEAKRYIELETARTAGEVQKAVYTIHAHHDQEVELGKSKKWKTAKLKTGDKDLDIASADPSVIWINNPNTQFSPMSGIENHRSNIPDWADVHSPKIATLEEVRRACQMYEQQAEQQAKLFEHLDGKNGTHQDWSIKQGAAGVAVDSCSYGGDAGWPSSAEAWPKPSLKWTCHVGWYNCGHCSNCIGTVPDARTVTIQTESTNSAESTVHTARAKDCCEGIVRASVNSPLLREGIELQDIPLPIRNEISATWLTEMKEKEAAMKSEKQDVPSVNGELNEPSLVSHEHRFGDFDYDTPEDLPVPKGKEIFHDKVTEKTNLAQISISLDFFTIDEFRKVTDYHFTCKEASDILQMCGGNLDAAISMYRNSSGPLHLRQMLLTWLYPPEIDDGITIAKALGQGEAAEAEAKVCHNCWAGCGSCCLRDVEQEVLKDDFGAVFCCSSCNVYTQKTPVGGSVNCRRCNSTISCCKEEGRPDLSNQYDKEPASGTGDGLFQWINAQSTVPRIPFDDDSKLHNYRVTAEAVLEAGSQRGETGELDLGTRIDDVVSHRSSMWDAAANFEFDEPDTKVDTTEANSITENADGNTATDVKEALAALGIEVYNFVTRKTLCLYFGEAVAHSTPEHAVELVHAFNTIIKHHDENNCWKLCCAPWNKAKYEKLIQMKTEDSKITWDAISEELGVSADECRECFRKIKPKDWKPHWTKWSKGKECGLKNQATTEAPAAPNAFSGENFWGSINADKEDACDIGGGDARGYPVQQRGWGGDNSVASCASTVIDNGSVPESKPSVETCYVVTYWATVECGEKSIHIPIDSKNVSGPEKTIVEGSLGMKKVWKWIQEKCLGDKVGLQDAFDLAEDMHGDDEVKAPVVTRANPFQPTSHTLKAFCS